MGCGQSRPKAELLRFVRSGDAVAPDPAARAPGRGAYLCRRPECARLALRRRGFERSFRGSVKLPDNLIDLAADG